ncbi:MAG: 3-keto-5-aminohexanoate cleavage protein [Myxococcota bacterium]|jgi:3-keto-5-aminohexanoate cleavage enzyme
MQPLIITAAMVGAEVTRDVTPFLPLTPEEIGEEALKCREAGAVMVHLHVRDAEGRPTQDMAVFSRAIEEIRRRTDIIIQASTGGAVGMAGEERCQPLFLGPEMCTISTGTVNFGDGIFENSRSLMIRVAELARANSVVPEIEVFDSAFIDNALWLASKGYLSMPAHFDFVLGVPGGLGADEAALDFLRSRIPAGSTWSVAGIGRHEFPMAELSIAKGGHVRVGLEDNIFVEKRVLARGNADLVRKAAGMAVAAGRRVATMDEARAILRLPVRTG